MITVPANGATLSPGIIVIEGTAEDDEGVVAAVEVSLDGGNRWHPVEGRENWRFVWEAAEPGSYEIVCRAVDDSGWLEKRPFRSHFIHLT